MQDHPPLCAAERGDERSDVGVRKQIIMKKTILILSAVIALSACRETKSGAFTVSGKIEHAPAQKIFLQEFHLAENNP